MKNCKICDNTLEKVTILTRYKTKPDKTIKRDICRHCSIINWESSDKGISSWTYEDPPGKSDHLDFKQVGKIEGLWSSAFEHYIVSRQSLQSGLAISGTIAACECLEKLLKGLVIMESSEKKYFFKTLIELFKNDKNHLYGHTPYDLYEHYCKLVSSSSKVYLNKTFLKFLQYGYRLRYKLEDQKSKYSKDFRYWINTQKVLVELDRQVFNIMNKLTFSRETPNYFRKNCWDLFYNVGNSKVSQDNFFIKHLKDKNANQIKIQKEIENHFKYCDFLITELFIEVEEGERFLIQTSYETLDRSSFNIPFITKKSNKIKGQFLSTPIKNNKNFEYFKNFLSYMKKP